MGTLEEQIEDDRLA